MTSRTTIYIRAGDTEPLELTVGAELIDGSALASLDELTSAKLYARKRGATTNEVDGVALSVVDSDAMTVQFSPQGTGPEGADAFANPGTYDAYILCEWDDGDETRHPGDSDLHIVARANYEG